MIRCLAACLFGERTSPSSEFLSVATSLRIGAVAFAVALLWVRGRWFVSLDAGEGVEDDDDDEEEVILEVALVDAGEGGMAAAEDWG
mmetsp:Transcript_10313/g.25934  ORF Transcript_10313/g.25934 Transcript_10313/m.25934 type:complete len:87 (+) Transcript_10313:638-898(+)